MYAIKPGERLIQWNVHLFCYVCIFFICMLTLLLMPLDGRHFYVGLDFVTPSRYNLFFNLIKLQYYKSAMSYAKQTNNNGYNYELFEDRD
jgi:hypothetical protein